MWDRAKWRCLIGLPLYKYDRIEANLVARCTSCGGLH